MGAVVEEDRLTKEVTHVLAMNPEALVEKFGKEIPTHFRGVSWVFFSFPFCLT